MPSVRHKNIVPSRRRRDDDDDDEGSLAADVEDDSLSEGSPTSNGDDDADVEGSEASEQEAARASDVLQTDVSTNGVGVAIDQSKLLKANDGHSQPSSNSVFKNSADTNAMLNGLKTAADADAAEEIQFEDAVADMPTSLLKPVQAPSEGARQETPAERNRREHQEYLKKRDENPAFVPNRGGFFLHDNRSAAPGMNGVRPFAKGRGRGAFVGVPSTRGVTQAEPSDQQWAHDLHDSTVKVDQLIMPTSASLSNMNGATRTTMRPSIDSAPLAHTPPNRSFSTSTVVGNVPVHVYLPGMPTRIALKNMPKKQHTLLPQHRPPLRRDKPVRISIPDNHPRYIFPSVERSFIFIPRALRPNQQSYSRGRGRGSFAGSRRTSVYGGSTYSPSVAMSRRSSLAGGASQNGIRSPATGAFPRQPGAAGEPGKPVVRLPPMARQNVTMPMPAPSSTFAPPAFMPAQAQQQLPQPQPTTNQSQQSNIPMHQPRPQKAVSVADIESPATFSYNPPQQQQEQPFHQQVPTDVNIQPFSESSVALNSHSRRPSHPSQPSGTPLSHIPERAIYAPSFQPYSFAPPASYFTTPYPPGTLFYPPMGGDMPGYGGAEVPAVMAPAFVPGTPYVLAAPPPPPPITDAGAQSGTVAHESNGMVYYYDSTQLQQTTSSNVPPPYSAAPPGGVVGMGGMITPPSQHFYYPQASNGIYFGPQ